MIFLIKRESGTSVLIGIQMILLSANIHRPFAQICRGNALLNLTWVVFERRRTVRHPRYHSAGPLISHPAVSVDITMDNNSPLQQSLTDPSPVKVNKTRKLDSSANLDTWDHKYKIEKGKPISPQIRS